MQCSKGIGRVRDSIFIVSILDSLSRLIGKLFFHTKDQDNGCHRSTKRDFTVSRSYAKKAALKQGQLRILLISSFSIARIS